MTTVCWIATAYLAPETDRRCAQVAFYRKVRPFGPGWEPIRRVAGNLTGTDPVGANIPMALAGWVAGSLAVWSALFAVGNYLYGRLGYAALMTAVFLVSSAILVTLVKRLWAGIGRHEASAHP